MDEEGMSAPQRDNLVGLSARHLGSTDGRLLRVDQLVLLLLLLVLQLQLA